MPEALAANGMAARIAIQIVTGRQPTPPGDATDSPAGGLPQAPAGSSAASS